jgi:hypothetical protein
MLVKRSFNKNKDRAGENRKLGIFQNFKSQAYS